MDNDTIFDYRMDVLDKIIFTIFLFVIGVVIYGLSFLIAKPVHVALVPDGLQNADDVCVHEWNIIESDIGLYDGYKVYCPICSDVRTCYVDEFKKYQIDKDYERNGN